MSDKDVIDTIIAEAGSDKDGLTAVAYSILNRAEKSGKTPAFEVRRKSQYEGYSNPGSGSRAAQKDPKVRALAEQVWADVQARKVPDPLRGGTMFHANSIKPYWADAENKHGTTQIGGQTFYLGNAKPNSALAAIDAAAPTVPARRPESLSAYQALPSPRPLNASNPLEQQRSSGLAPPTTVRTVSIDPLTGFPRKPQPAVPRAAWIGDSGPAAMSVTSRLGNDLTNFSDAVAAPTYGDYAAAADLAARRYSTPVPAAPSRSVAPSRFDPIGTPPTWRDVRQFQGWNPAATAPVAAHRAPSTVPKTSPNYGNSQKPYMGDFPNPGYVQTATRTPLTGSGGMTGTPSRTSLTGFGGMTGNPSSATAPSAQAPATKPARSWGTLPGTQMRDIAPAQYAAPGTGGSPLSPGTWMPPNAYVQKTYNDRLTPEVPAVAAIKAAAPTLPRGMELHNRSRDSLAYAAAGRNAVANMPPVVGRDGIIDLTASNPKKWGAQGTADTQGRPVRVGNTIYYPGGKAPVGAPQARNAPATQQRSGGLGGLLGSLFGGGNLGNAGRAGAVAVPGASVAVNATQPSAAYTTTPFQENAFQTTPGALMPASMNNERWRSGY